MPIPSLATRPGRRALLTAAAAATLSLVAPLASAQAAFPTKPITIMVPFGPGGVADITARTVAEHMAKTLGQSVVVENKPSAGSIVASQAVKAAAPDGHTLLLMSNGHAVSVGMMEKLPYDPQKDFAPISTLGFFDLGLFVPANSRFVNFGEMMAFAKANPGKLNVGTIAVGSTQNLSARLFETVAGVKFLVVPYKASPAVVAGLRGGEIEMSFEIVGPMVGQVKGGALRALAVTSDRRNAALPDVPTAIQGGVAGYNVASWNALAAPVGTPPAVIEALNKAARAAVASPEVQAKLGNLGMRVEASSPEGLKTLLAEEIQRWGEVIRSAGLRQ
ncbi:MAG: hypothetical protein RLZ83_2033 [Pseudomonadota bacterium]|jgi:tripartite-type tricarboxylate transporter receptor subunit TctC